MANLSKISRESLIGKVMRAPLRLIPRTAVLPILQGNLRGKKWIVGSGNHGCWLGSYEQEKQRLFADTLKPGDVVYDVGANAGIYSLLASILVGPSGHVYSFEPLPANAHNLQRHLDLNRIVNCTLIEAAVCSRDGRASFEPSSDGYMARLESRGSLSVRTVTLDALSAHGEIQPPNVMKIDVEGAEYECLQGGAHLIQTVRPVLFLATHSPNLHQQCLDLLAKWNYCVASIDRRPVEQTDEFICRPGSSI